MNNLPCPEPRTKSKRNATLNAKAAADCITDDAIYIRGFEEEKAETKKEKEEKKIEKNVRE